MDARPTRKSLHGWRFRPPPSPRASGAWNSPRPCASWRFQTIPRMALTSSSRSGSRCAGGRRRMSTRSGKTARGPEHSDHHRTERSGDAGGAAGLFADQYLSHPPRRCDPGGLRASIRACHGRPEVRVQCGAPLTDLDLDGLDRQVIEALGRDARISNRQIASDLGVAEATIRTRIRRLQAAHLIHFTALTDFRIVGSPTLVLFGIDADPRQIPKLAAELSAMPEINCVMVLLGRYDLLAT